MSNVGPPNVEQQNPGAAGEMPPGLPAALHHILAALLSRDSNMVYGDAVHSDEALDRIISMLMETHQDSAGAPPASQTALDELERKKVDNKMLGAEGHAECTICISEVVLDEEVISLPCKHWFHEECVVMWLKQHNTCPVCRNPVVAKSEAEARQSADQSTARNDGPANNNSSSRASAASATGGLNNINLTRGLSTLRDWATGSSSANGNGGNNNNSSSSSSSSVNTGNYSTLNGLFGGDTHMTGSTANSAVPNMQSLFPPPTSATSTATSSPPLTGMRERIHHNRDRDRVQRNMERAQQLNEYRINAIRRAAGLPPTTIAPTRSSNSSSGSSMSHLYRSSRIPERSAAVERERRRRDSHSPNPGRNHSSSRYSIPEENDDWLSHHDDALASSMAAAAAATITAAPSLSSSPSRARRQSPSSQSSNAFNQSQRWSVMGDRPAPFTGHDSAPGLDHENERQYRSYFSRPDMYDNGWNMNNGGSGAGHAGASNYGALGDQSSHWRPPSLSNHNPAFPGPAPEASNAGHTFASWRPSSYLPFGGDGHSSDSVRTTDNHGPHSLFASHAHSNGNNAGARNDNASAGGSSHEGDTGNNGQSNGGGSGGGSGGFFNFIRGLGNGHPSANNARRRS